MYFPGLSPSSAMTCSIASGLLFSSTSTIRLKVTPLHPTSSRCVRLLVAQAGVSTLSEVSVSTVVFIADSVCRLPATLDRPIILHVSRTRGTLSFEKAPLTCGYVGWRYCLQVIPGVGEVETFVGQREVRHDRVGQCYGQRRPVQEGGVDDLEAGNGPVGTDLDALDDRAAPALDQSDSGHLPRRNPGGHVPPCPAVPSVGQQLGEQFSGGLDLAGTHAESGQDIPSGFDDGAYARGGVVEGVVSASVVVYPTGSSNVAEDPKVMHLLPCEYGGASEAVPDDAVVERQLDELCDLVGDRPDLRHGGQRANGSATGSDRPAQQPVSGHVGVEAQQLFTNPQRVSIQDAVADVIAHPTDVGDVVVHPLQLQQHRTQHTRRRGHLPVQSLLDSQRERECMPHGGVPRNPLGQWQRLQGRPTLREFLDALVGKPQTRLELEDRLPHD